MRRFEPWQAGRRVGVAVSGGADSLSLAWLAHRWGAAVGYVIDHGLRAESAGEAALTATRLAGFGMAARVRRIALDPGPALAARARDARYAALAQMAAADGVLDLLVGHHARDQAETLLMRRLARSGPAGLAAMTAVAEARSLRIIRPLLAMPPLRLRATLVRAGMSWIEDPTNDSPTALRSRLRRSLAGAAAEEDGVAALGADARRSGLDRSDGDRMVADLLAERAALHPEGYAILSSGPIAPAALAALIRMVTGAAYPAPVTDVRRLAEDPRPATLAGARLLAAGKLGPGLLVVREAAAMAPAVAAVPGAHWDRRFRLADDFEAPAGMMLGAVGDDAPQVRARLALPAEVVRTLPVLRDGEGIVGGALGPGMGFQPSSPAAGAGFFV